MGVSRPRKGGQYCGGRPFPVYCPACRKCNGTKPTHFYNSRGLCNICHKIERQTSRKSRWPNTPPMISEKELRQLRKNPLKWLRNIMTDSHARTIPEKLHELECWRIVHVTACRWYGEAVQIDPIELELSEDSVWRMSASASEADMPAPIFQPKVRAKRKRRVRTEKGKLISMILRPLVADLRVGIPDLLPPEVTFVLDEWAAYWVTPSGAGVALSGPRNAPVIATVALIESETIATVFPYDFEMLKIVWCTFHALQTQVVDVP